MKNGNIKVDGSTTIATLVGICSKAVVFLKKYGIVWVEHKEVIEKLKN